MARGDVPQRDIPQTRWNLFTADATQVRVRSEGGAFEVYRGVVYGSRWTGTLVVRISQYRVYLTLLV